MAPGDLQIGTRNFLTGNPRLESKFHHPSNLDGPLAHDFDQHAPFAPADFAFITQLRNFISI